MRFGDALFSDKPKLDGDAVHSRARYVQMQMDADGCRWMQMLVFLETVVPQNTMAFPTNDQQLRWYLAETPHVASFLCQHFLHFGMNLSSHIWVSPRFPGELGKVMLPSAPFHLDRYNFSTAHDQCETAILRNSGHNIIIKHTIELSIRLLPTVYKHIASMCFKHIASMCFKHIASMCFKHIASMCFCFFKSSKKYSCTCGTIPTHTRHIRQIISPFQGFTTEHGRHAGLFEDFDVLHVLLDMPGKIASPKDAKMRKCVSV